MNSIVRNLPSLQPAHAEKLAQLPGRASDDETGQSIPDDQPNFCFSRMTYRQSSRAGHACAKKASKAKGRRQRYHPATSDAVYSDSDTKLLKAIDAHRLATGHQFLSVTEILRIAEKSLGYHTPGQCFCHHDTPIDVG